MKIVLELDEINILRSFERRRSGDPTATNRLTRSERAKLRDLFEAGLVRGEWPSYDKIFGPIYITPLGVKILNENTPYIEPLNKAGAVYDSEGALLKWGVSK